MKQLVAAGAIGAVLVLVVACNDQPNPIRPTPGPPPPTPATAVFVGAGDIADCNNDGGRHAEDTARLLDRIEGTVFAAGDLAYPDGSIGRFQTCYEPRWGRHKRRTRPAPGNHEYESPGAFPYYNYFGDAAGMPGDGFYSFALGNWHIISLNSNVSAATGSVQWLWLRQDLADDNAKCTLAFWHHPVFTSGPSSGEPGSTRRMQDVWRLLYDNHVEIVVNGHDHFYERFSPQDPEGRISPTTGVRQFTAGTGGAPLYPFVSPRPNGEVRIAAYGVLKLTLHLDSYDWSFIEAGTEAVRDSGTGALCN